MNFVSHGITRIQTESRRIRKSKKIRNEYYQFGKIILSLVPLLVFSVFLSPGRLGFFFPKINNFQKFWEKFSTSSEFSQILGKIIQNLSIFNFFFRKNFQKSTFFKIFWKKISS